MDNVIINITDIVEEVTVEITESGDMMSIVYDPTGVKANLFQYADGKTITGEGTSSDPFVAVGGAANTVLINTGSTGHVTGGFITPTGGINIHVTAGSGYITDNATFYTEVFWDAADLQTVVDGRNFVMVDIDGNVFVSGIVDNYYNYIVYIVFIYNCLEN